MFDRLYIELENDAMRYIHGSISGRKLKIRNHGRVNLEPGCFVNGKVMDEAGFENSLRELKKNLSMLRTTVHLTVNDGSFITRPVELPILKDKDIEKHLSLEAEQYLPISRNSFQVSFRVMGRRSEADEAGSSVMVSAGPKESIEGILRCFDKCRLDVKVIDVYPNNICRLLKDFPEDDFAVVDMGRRSINITIMEKKRFYMHSYMSANMDTLFEDCARDIGTGMDVFRKEYFHVSYDHEQVNKDEAVLDENLRAALSDVIRQVARYLDYFNSRHFGKTVDNVYVIGENATLKGLRNFMSDSFNTRVTIGLKPSLSIDHKRKDSFTGMPAGYYSVLGMMSRGKKL